MEQALDQLSRFCYLMLAQFGQLWPYWISGVALGALVKQPLKGPRLSNCIARAGRFGIPVGALLGVLSPLCLFGALPVLASFMEAGLSVGAVWAFLVSSPLLNPNLFILTWGGLGAKLAVTRLVVAIALGIIAGLTAEFLIRRTGSDWLYVEGLNGGAAGDGKPASEAEAACAAETVPRLPAFSWKKVLTDFRGSLIFTGEYLLMGMALAALVEVLVPTAWVMKVLGGAESGFAVLIATGLGVPLYMCGGGSIPLMKAWMYTGTLTNGGALAFMVAGPSTKASNFTALYKALGKKGFALYLTINIAGAVAVGYAVDLAEKLHIIF